MCCGVIHFIAWQEARVLTLIVATLSSICGLLFLFGLFNWLDCSLGALISMGTALSQLPVPMLSVMTARISAVCTAVIAIALLCLGPGAYSLDARRHGRREIIIPARPRSSDENSPGLSLNYLDRVAAISVFLGKKKTLYIGMRSASWFARVATTGNTNRKLGREAMETVGTLELPTRVSLCLRLFIETLFDEVDVKRAASGHQNHQVQSAIPKAIQTEDALANETARNRVVQKMTEPISFTKV